MEELNLPLKIKRFARTMKCCIKALYISSQDPRTPKLAKYLITIVIAYALSPIDLIPDFIPVLGYLDDLILLPLAIYLVIKLIPNDVWSECILKAQEHHIDLHKNRAAVFYIVATWALGVTAMLIYLVQIFK